MFYYSTHDATLPNGIVKYLQVIHNRDLADGISLSSSSKMVVCFIQRPQHCQNHHLFSLLEMFSVAYQQPLTIKSVFLICSDFGQIVFSHWHENEHLIIFPHFDVLSLPTNCSCLNYLFYGFHWQLGVLRKYTFDHSSPGLLVEALDVSLLALFQRGVDEHLEEGKISGSVKLAGHDSVLARDQRLVK